MPSRLSHPESPSAAHPVSTLCSSARLCGFPGGNERIQRLDFGLDFRIERALYPAAMRLPALARAAGVDVRHRPFMLGAIFKAQGWTTFSVQRLRCQGPLHVAGSRAYLHRPGAVVRPPRSCFRRTACWQHAVLSPVAVPPWVADFSLRGIPGRSFLDGRQISTERSFATSLRRLASRPIRCFGSSDIVEIKGLLRSETEQAERLGILARRASSRDDGELFWGNDRVGSGARMGPSRCASSSAHVMTDPVSPPTPR